MIDFEDQISLIQSNLIIVQEKMHQAAQRSKRVSGDIKLIVVSKGRTIETNRAAISAGILDFGENYPEVAESKIIGIGPYPGIKWHMIGHLQSRKTGIIAAHFDYLHSLDSLKLAKKIDRAMAAQNRKLPVLLEFNVSGEESKFGWDAKDRDSWPRLAEEIQPILTLVNIEVRGLMTMPPFSIEPNQTRIYFAKLRQLRDYFSGQHPDIGWDELSMGTSVDYEVAIEEGATFVRIGQAILGKRPLKG